MSEEIPDSWPPGPQDLDAFPVVPMFPLPGVFLFPRQLMPLHIFEPRYREMIEDSLDGPGRIVMGSVTEEPRTNTDGEPEVLPVAGLGEIARHEKLPDGRFLIWVFGLARVRIEEIPSDQPYRRVRFAPLQEVEPTEREVEELSGPLRAAILSRAQGQDLPPDVPLELLADLLLQRTELPPEEMEGLFVEASTAERARGALAAHARHPPPPDRGPGEDEGLG